MEDVRSGKLIGGFSITEQDSSEIRTTCTYEHKSGQFVLDSPHLSSISWVGNLEANCCVVFARTIVNDEDKGIHPFFVMLKGRIIFIFKFDFIILLL